MPVYQRTPLIPLKNLISCLYKRTFRKQIVDNFGEQIRRVYFFQKYK